MMPETKISELARFPRPDMARPDFLLLDGDWQFEFDPRDKGIKQKWFESPNFSQTIRVPYCVESEASGINVQNPAPVFWYARTNVAFPSVSEHEKLLLHFGAVDYHATVWVNSILVGEHSGGYTPFSFDITSLAQKQNSIVVRVEDAKSLVRPRGKQTTFSKASGIFYPTISGMWQSVWLEKTGSTYLENFTVDTDMSARSARFSCTLVGQREGKLSCMIRDPLNNKTYKKTTPFHKGDGQVDFEFSFKTIAPWSPDNPQLYAVTFQVMTDQSQDEVRSYFGFRTIERRANQVFLTGKSFYQKLVLVQGYFPDGLYTPADENIYREDILVLKNLGFNGVRMHQKIENPKFLFWCDVLGCVVWEEMPSARHFTPESQAIFKKEWIEVVARDRNHPSIITWVLFNESWGLGPYSLPILSSQSAVRFVKDMVLFTKQLDSTRLVIDNSGFDHTDLTDIVDLHVYLPTPQATHKMLEHFRTRHSRFSWFNFLFGLSVRSPLRQRFARGESYQNQPVIVSEYGGFGHFKTVSGGLVENYQAYTNVIKQHAWLTGYCFTQLYDTFQEKDGLLDENRKPKAALF